MNPEEEKEKALWREKKHLEIKSELMQNEKFQKFVAEGYPTSRESFISEYAREKVNWIEWGPKHLQWLERDDMQWMNEATDRLKEIQQKKLFDVQCQWRAEKITLPGIHLTRDFYYWESNIFNCSFIPPISPEEVEMYVQYLQSSNFEEQQGFLDQWQDYEEIKEAYVSEDANRNFPDWYDFYNGRTGASVYMLLPDIRGEKEEFYLDFWRKELNQKRTEAMEKHQQEEEVRKIQQEAGIAVPELPPDKRPFLSWHKKGWMTWFITTYEDKATQDVFTRFGGERAFDEYDQFLEDDLHVLCHAEQPVPIEGWFDWKEAIHRTAQKYRIKKILEALPLAYDQYRMNVDTGIPFPEVKSPFPPDDWYHKAVLRGRELNGEPQDFNF